MGLAGRRGMAVQGDATRSTTAAAGLRPGDRLFIRQWNTALVLDAIRRRSPIARVRLAELTGLSKSTVTSVVQRLVEIDLVRPAGAGRSRGGRPPELLELNPDRYAIVAIKVQPDGIVAGCATLLGTIRHRTVTPWEDPVEEAVVPAIVAAARGVVQRAGIDWSRVLGVGLALPGLVDGKKGVWVNPHFFPWRGMPLQEWLLRELDVPIVLENDAAAAGLGEKWAAVPSGPASFVFVSLGIGIGGSVVQVDRLRSGEIVGAGHIGHVTVVPDGLPCQCGGQGCLETIANDAALVRYYRRYRQAGATGGVPGTGHAGTATFLARAGEPASGRRAPRAESSQRDAVIAAARAGDQAALRAIERVAEHVGASLAGLITVLGMPDIVVGGEMADTAGDLLLGPLAAAVRLHVFPEVRDRVRVRPARLGSDVWLAGAAALVLEEALRAPGEEAPKGGVAALATLA